MARLIGPDFIGIQVEDLDAAKAFYGEVLGLELAEHSPPGAVVFDTRPVPFAVRTPTVELKMVERLGWGLAIWFGCDDADALHHHLSKQGVSIVFPPKNGPFGRYFAFEDPFGYTITTHTLGDASANLGARDKT